MSDFEDAYPSDGMNPAFTEPEDQKTERKQEEGKSHAAKQTIEEVLERLQRRIDHYKSVRSIEVDLNEDPATHQKRVAVGQLMVENLNQEWEYWNSRLPQR